MLFDILVMLQNDCIPEDKGEYHPVRSGLALHFLGLSQSVLDKI